MTESRISSPVSLATGLTTLLLIVTSVAAIYVIGIAIFGAVNGGQEVTSHQDVPGEELGSLPPSVVPGESVPVTIRIRDAEPHQLLLATSRDLIVIALGVAILWLVRALLLSVREGDPFTSRNVRRLRTIGFILVFGFPVGGLATQFLDEWLAASSSVGELGSTFPGAMQSGLVVGLIVFVLAEVFAHGVRLREDVEGTI